MSHFMPNLSAVPRELRNLVYDYLSQSLSWGCLLTTSAYAVGAAEDLV